MSNIDLISITAAFNSASFFVKSASLSVAVRSSALPFASFSLPTSCCLASKEAVAAANCSFDFACSFIASAS